MLQNCNTLCKFKKDMCNTNTMSVTATATVAVTAAAAVTATTKAIMATT